MIAFSTSALTPTFVRASDSLVLHLRTLGLRRPAFWHSSCAKERRRPVNEIVGIRNVRLIIGRKHPSRPETMSTSGCNAGANVIDIEEIHRQAILGKQSTYIDPPTGFTVFTELAHLKRGKCCGNQCRHCPYGWSNVKSTGAGCGITTSDNHAKAVSGDREMTGRLVKRILNGTYYKDRECSSGAVSNNGGATGNQRRLVSNENVMESDCTSDPVEPVHKGRGKGGYAGGTLTSKNVPYTRKGDTGTSQLFTGERRSKDDDVFEALGTVDELCCIVGLVYAELISLQSGDNSRTTEKAEKDDLRSSSANYGDLPEQLLEVMSRLFDVGSHIARPTPRGQKHSQLSNEGKTVSIFNCDHTVLLEEWIDTMTDQLPELTSFILPTGSPASAQLHVARTVCRRAERRMVPLFQEVETCFDPAALAYVNRLSDYFFTAARFVNYCENRDEVQYRQEERALNSNRVGQAANSQRERVVVKLKK